jgi:hypothetical protein
MLDSKGVVACNVAKGVYTYSPPNQPLGPKFAPACIVEKTFGDRRLGTHLLSGIMVLLPHLVDESALDADRLLVRCAVFDSSRSAIDFHAFCSA